MLEEAFPSDRREASLNVSCPSLLSAKKASMLSARDDDDDDDEKLETCEEAKTRKKGSA